MESNSIVLNLVVLLIYLLMMTSVGLSLEARHFLALSRLKLSIVGLLIAQTIALPVVALLVVSFLPLPPHINTAVLLLAACPIGDIVNFYVDALMGPIALVSPILAKLPVAKVAVFDEIS